MVHIEDELMIEAPPERVFAALQGELGDLERTAIVSSAEDGLAAEFATKVGPLTFHTREKVTLHPPQRMQFEHLRGPFKLCYESLTFVSTGEGTAVRHSADFSLPLPLLGDLFGRVVAGPIFRAVVRKHLVQVKEKLEAEISGR